MCHRYSRAIPATTPARKKIGQKLLIRGVLYEIKVIEPWDGPISVISPTTRHSKKFVNFEALELLVREEVAQWI